LWHNFKKNDKDMESAVKNSPLNETQIILLQAFSRIKSEEEKTDIQDILLNYYRKRVDAYANTISMNDEMIEEILTSHYRTTYK
jgi:hypothetical protein